LIEIDLLGYIKTPPIPIPVPKIDQQIHSFPQTQSGINFHIDPPSHVDSDELIYLYNHHRYSSGPVP
jgi:hypothetical protein